jgi:hypothetical protein
MSDQDLVREQLKPNPIRIIAAASLVAIGVAFLVVGISQFFSIASIQAGLREIHASEETLGGFTRNRILWGIAALSFASVMIGEFLLLARHLPRNNKLLLAAIFSVVGVLIYPFASLVLFYVSTSE